MRRARFGRAHIHRARSASERAADLLTRWSGTFTFLWVHAAVWFVWLHTGLFGMDHRPYALLTMVLSLEAICLSSIVLMSQTREARKNQERDKQEAFEVNTLYRQGVRLAQLIEELHAQRGERRCRYSPPPPPLASASYPYQAPVIITSEGGTMVPPFITTTLDSESAEPPDDLS